MILERSFGIVPVAKKGGEYQFLLICQQAGHWSFPKGHPEKGETAIKTAKREFSEETGLKEVEIVDGVDFKMHYVHKKKGKYRIKTVKYFLGIIKNNGQEPEVQKEEIKYYRWANFEDAMNLLTYKNAKQILVKAQQYLKD